MAKYKIQLHPESAPLTVSSREDVEKILAFYSRLKRVNTVAYPYFMYPRTIPPIEAVNAGKAIFPYPAIKFIDAEGGDCKECYRWNLREALVNVYREEANLRKAGKEVAYTLLDAGESEYKRAEAEALEILTLIDEYRALPEALPYVERNK